MKIDLLPIIDSKGSQLPIKCQVSVSDGDIDARSDVSGEVVNSSGTLEIKADVNAIIKSVCARCLKPVTETIEFKINDVVGEDGITLNGTVLDMGDVVRQNVFLNIPLKFICSEDCKGLCAGCGANLNTDKCSCGDEEIDERFAALKKLLD